MELKKTEVKVDEEKSKKFKDFLKKQEREKELIQASIDGNRKQVELQHAINDAVAIHGEKNREQITNNLTANKALEDQKDAIEENGKAAETLKDKFHNSFIF